METIPIHKAKSSLSQLVKRAAAGETIYIGSYGKPEAVLSAVPAVSSGTLRKEFIGCMKGKIPKELCDPLPQEVIDSFYSMRGLEDFEIK
jgi:prevent-host-death family protein